MRERRRRARCKDSASLFAYEDVGPTCAPCSTCASPHKLMKPARISTLFSSICVTKKKKELEPLFKVKTAFWYFALHCSHFLPLTSGNACWLRTSSWKCWLSGKQEGIHRDRAALEAQRVRNKKVEPGGKFGFGYLFCAQVFTHDFWARLVVSTVWQQMINCSFKVSIFVQTSPDFFFLFLKKQSNRE